MTITAKCQHYHQHHHHYQHQHYHYRPILILNIHPNIIILIKISQVKSDCLLLDEPFNLGLQSRRQDPHQSLGGKPGIDHDFIFV